MNANSCLECDIHFFPQRNDAKFCGIRCRSRYHMRHKRYQKKITQYEEARAGIEVMLRDAEVQEEKIASRLKQRYKYLKNHRASSISYYRKMKATSQSTETITGELAEAKVSDVLSKNSHWEDLTKTILSFWHLWHQSAYEYSQSEVKDLQKEQEALVAELAEIQNECELYQTELRRLDEKQLLEPLPSQRKRGVSSFLNHEDNMPKNLLKLEGAAKIANRSFKSITFPGELGRFIGDVDRYKTAFALTGDPGAGKSHLACAMAKLFSETGLKVAYFQLEMGKGAIFSRMLQGYDISNLVQIADEATIETVSQAASSFDCLIIDSFTKLTEDQNIFDRLVNQYPKTIFVAIFQKTSSGSIRGGSRIAFDSAAVVNVSSLDKRRIAQMQKSRYGTIGWEYDLLSEKVVNG